MLLQIIAFTTSFKAEECSIVYIDHTFLYLFIHRWTFRLVPLLSSCEQFFNEHGVDKTHGIKEWNGGCQRLGKGDWGIAHQQVQSGS